MNDYEKLGVFYLGREVDPSTGELSTAPLLYPSKDLTTHAVCVGMTGSGKTGLCLAMMEEAAMDGIPVLAVDPKGDLGNLLLQFPNLAPADFEPWVDPAEAARKGMDVKAYAAATAATWRNGLAAWDQSGDRIARLQNQAEFGLYTPGSSAGSPLSLLRSFAAPPPALLADAEILAERVDAAVSSLLALLGIVADPLQSREHILLAQLLRHAWERGLSPDLPALLQGLQSPPFDRVGFLDLESFYPAKDRMGLVLRLNNLLASAVFQVWLRGDPLDIGSLLYSPAGKPRVSILSIAHLGENERMFFVTLLLNELVAWMRTQSGTSSLRALFYMDEIFGYFPPSANPPSKKPMLTLLKQARACGLGCMLATQNPVDLDYKGLANTGTWLIGRLQTERDKLRVLDGLEGASVGQAFDRSALEKILSGLGNRRFLLHNVHGSGPVLFETRWVLSYLHGPLTRDQIRKLEGRAGEPLTALPPSPAAAPARESAPPASVPGPVLIPSGIAQFWLAPAPSSPVRAYRPCLAARVKLHHVRASDGIDLWREVVLLIPFREDPRTVSCEEMEELPDSTSFLDAPPVPAAAEPPPAAAANPKSYSAWERDVKQLAYEQCFLTLLTCPALRLKAEPGETAAAFAARVGIAHREARDREVEKIKSRYETRFHSLRERIRRVEDLLDRREAAHKERKLRGAISIGTSLLGALLGRKAISATNVRRAGSAMSAASRMGRGKEAVRQAEEELRARRQELEALEEAFRAELADLEARLGGMPAIEEFRLPPRKTDIRLTRFGLAWKPV